MDVLDRAKGLSVDDAVSGEIACAGFGHVMFASDLAEQLLVVLR